MTPITTNKQATSTLGLKEKVKWARSVALCRHLNITGTLDLFNLDLFNYTENVKKGTTNSEFYNCHE